MRAAGFLILSVMAFGQNPGAPPWVRQGGIVNAASRLPVNVPGGALAPGALISIEGLRFIPGRTMVEIEAGGRLRQATLIEETTERILARLPSFRTGGHARIFVRSGGRSSSGTDVVFAQAAFGIFTVNGQGWGPAASLKGSAATPVSLPTVEPGGSMTLYGTGLGSVATNDIGIRIGERTVKRVRRSEINGVDRLTFEVPKDVTPGCAVPAMVVTGTVVSNTGLLKVGHGDCEKGGTWYEQLRTASRKTGSVLLLHSDVILELTPGKPVPFQVDNLLAGFTARPALSAAGPPDLLPAAGDCLAWGGAVETNNLALPVLQGPAGDGADPGLDLGPEIADRTRELQDLDAGEWLSVEGSAGVRKAFRARRNPRVYSSILGGNPPVTKIPATPLFLAPGRYLIGIPGGADVKEAGVALEVPVPLIWKNRDAVTNLDRLAGTELEWSLPAGYTAMVFAWNIDRRNGFGGIAVCRPPLRATHFRLPATAVANLPATVVSGSDLSLGFIGIAALPVSPPGINAGGLDYAKAIAASLSGRTVIVK